MSANPKPFFPFASTWTTLRSQSLTERERGPCSIREKDSLAGVAWGGVGRGGGRERGKRRPNTDTLLTRWCDFRSAQGEKGEKETKSESLLVQGCPGLPEVSGKVKRRAKPEPNHEGWKCKIEAQSEYVHIACTFFAHLAPSLYAQSMPINKISAAELSRKSIKSALLVGYS